MIPKKALELLWDKGSIGFAVVDRDGRFVAINPRFCEIVGHPSVALTGRTFARITHPNDQDTDVAMTEQVIAGEVDSYRMFKTYIRGDNTMVMVELVVYPIFDEDGKFHMFLSQIIPVTVDGEVEIAQPNLWSVLLEVTRTNGPAVGKVLMMLAGLISAVAMAILKLT